MPTSQSAEQFAAGLWDSMRGHVAALAPHFSPGYGNSELTPEQELAIWNDRQLSIEQEWELWDQGLSAEEIGMRVFPYREQLVKSGGRVEPEQWIAKANALAKRAFVAAKEPPSVASPDAPPAPEPAPPPPMPPMPPMRPPMPAAPPAGLPVPSPAVQPAPPGPAAPAAPPGIQPVLPSNLRAAATRLLAPQIAPMLPSADLQPPQG